MRASLLEMVLAICIAGLIFASAIIPTTQTAVAYQRAESAVRDSVWQVTAVVRAEQIAASIWRDAEPPAGHETLQTAAPAQLKIGDWELREDSGRLQQKRASTAWQSIAEPVQSFSFGYLLNSGSWTSSVSAAQLDDVLAVRFTWSDVERGRPYGGLIVAPDRAFGGGLIELPQPDTSQAYEREDYERKITLSLGSWQ